MEHPRDYRYSLDHCWVHVVGESARVGVCPGLVAQGAVSDVTLPRLGSPIGSGDQFASLVLEGKLIEISSPIAGSVVLVNERLNEEPALVDLDPFGAGWLIEVQLSYDETLEGVMGVDSYLRIDN